MSGRIAEVAVAAPLEKSLNYLVPDELAGRARVGVRVEVPLGRRRAVGYILALSEGEGEGLKPLRAVLDEAPLFSPGLVPFLRRAADYYRYPIGEAIRTALPAGLSSADGKLGVLTESSYSATALPGEPRGEKQREILAAVRAAGEMTASELRERFADPHAVLRRLVELEYLSAQTRERLRDPFFARPVEGDTPPQLTEAQRAAVEAISGALGGFSSFLLHGITGSGKTEVYLHAIGAALEAGHQALVLVPEIALTPQLVARFRARFAPRGVRIAVLHSGLSDGERYDAWRRIARGEADIVIGARSAVFAPLPSCGIIVVDEEHEGSYKQGEGFRYHARDLALLRGKMEGGVIVMGSATPSLTTYHRARQGQIGYLELPGRARSQPLPQVELIDLREHRECGTLSPPLVAALGETLERGEQALLLLNRRGFAPFLLCAACGTTFRCPNCEITLTYHQGARELRCHYCDYSDTPPETCPSCSGYDLLPEGAGTERLEEELAGLLPDARIARMDRDTTTRKGAHQGIVDRMSSGEIDILVGTQMVAKGHDFPGVTLVGVISADSTLNFPDFRSAERTFSLLTQVAGRAGRGDRPGRVLIQTWSPDHFALECASRHDYQAFYAEESVARSDLGYPPYGHLVNLVLSGNDPARVSRSAEALAAELYLSEVEVLGPAPCPLSRLRGKSRMQILLKAPTRTPLHRLLTAHAAWRRALEPGVRLTIDVDPMDML